MTTDDAECVSRWLGAADRGELSEGEACIVAEVRRLRAENERQKRELLRIRDMTGAVVHTRDEDCVGACCGCMQLTPEEAVAYALRDLKAENERLRAALDGYVKTYGQLPLAAEDRPRWG